MTQSAEQRARDFTHALADVPTQSTSRNATWAKVGLALQLLGLALALIALALSQKTSNALEQSTDISLGLVGLAAVGLGAAVYLRYSLGQLLRFWLLRLSADVQHPSLSSTAHNSSTALEGTHR